MKKFNKRYVYYHFIIDIFIALFIGFFFLAMLVDEETDAFYVEGVPYVIIGAIVFYILFVIYHFFYYRTSGYELTNKDVKCQKGVLFKTKSIIEYKNIHAVNKKQGIIQKLFKIATLCIDSGSTNTADHAEVVIIEDEDVVDELIQQIKLLQQNKEIKDSDSQNLVEENKKRENLFEFTSKRKFLHALLTSFISILVLIFLIIAFFLLVIIANIVKDQELLNSLQEAFFGMLFIFLLVEIFILIIGTISSFVSYHQFRIYKNEDDLEVNYGLLVKHTNTFKLKKIRAVRICQGLINRIFGFVKIKIEVIGYTENSNNENESYTSGVLIPLCKKSEVNEILSKILPSYIPLKKEYKAKKYLPFILWPILIESIIFVLSLVYFSIFFLTLKMNDAFLISLGFHGVVYLVTILLTIVDRLFAYHNNAISINDNKVTIFFGSFYKEEVVILKEDIISIEDVTTPLRKKHNIYSYIIHFRSNMLTNVVKCDIIDEEVRERLLDLMKY